MKAQTYRIKEPYRERLSTDLGGHSWVCRPGFPEVVWCEHCGNHRVEVPDWEENPPCPALEAV